MFESRILSLAQIAALHFDGKPEMAKKRVQKLKAAGFILERPRKSFEPSLLGLGKKAFDLLSEKGILAEYPRMSIPALVRRGEVSKLTLLHELECNEVKTAFVLALRKTETFTLQEFTTWPTLSEFEALSAKSRTDVTVKPDGFLRIRETAEDGIFEHSFFFELDRSTESQERLAEKAACYADYYRRGGFAIRNGGTRENYKDHPFRVLVVCKSEARRDNAAMRMLELTPPVLTQVMLTTLKEVVENPLGEIWVRPVDYKAANHEVKRFENRARELVVKRGIL